MAGCHLPGWVLQPKSQRYLPAPAALMAPRGLVPACREPSSSREGTGRVVLCREGLVPGEVRGGGGYQGPDSFLFLFKLVSFVTRHNKIIFLKS